MPDPDAVAAALARLVTGTASARSFDKDPTQDGHPPPDRLVAEAEAAIDALPTAAAFVADGGEQRLRHVVEDSTDEHLVERGRAVLRALERLRTAAAAELDEQESPTETRPADTDHFHRGHTTLLKGDGVATE